MTRVRDGCHVATRLALLLGFACPGIFSQNSTDHDRWAVQISADGGSRRTEPNCHPSEYFTDGIRQIFLNEFKDPKNPNFFEDTVSARRIGQISGRKIEQYEHRINHGSQNPMTVKMLLVEREPREFCEIYRQQFSPDTINVEPAFLVHVADETVLASTDPWAGNSGQRQDVYWTFDKDGPLWLDVDSKVEEALKEFRPKEFIIMGGGGFNIRTLTYGMPLWKPNDPHCCPTGGSIEIKFALKDHQLVVVSHSHKPN